MNTITENTKTYYVLVVEGQEVGGRSESKAVIDLAKSQLPVEKQQLAEVKTITENGQQVLLG